MDIISEEWESSSFIKKNTHLLLVFYLHEADKDPRDYVVKIVRMWDFPAEDLEIIHQDWETIVEKVRAGLAHELSEGDTLYLGACTKSSDSSRASHAAVLRRARQAARVLAQGFVHEHDHRRQPRTEARG